MAFDVDDALMRVIENEGSDLHIKVPSAPLIRRHGKLEPVEGAEHRAAHGLDAAGIRAAIAAFA